MSNRRRVSKRMRVSKRKKWARIKMKANLGEEEEGEHNKDGALVFTSSTASFRGSKRHCAQLHGGCLSCFETELPPCHQAHCPE